MFEKLQKYGFDFIAAQLGNSENKKDFIYNKQTKYPDFNEYKYDSSKCEALKTQVAALERELQEMLSANNRIAEFKTQLSAIKTEKQYFDEYYNETYEKAIEIKKLSTLNSSQMLQLWIECQSFSEQNREISFRITSYNVCYTKLLRYNTYFEILELNL